MSPRSSLTYPRRRISAENLIRELGSLETDAARRKFLAHNRSLVRSHIVKLLAPAVVDQIRTDAHAALRLAEAALLIARKLRRKGDIALALRAKANALFASDDNLGAVEHHDQAFKIYESLKIWKEAARTLSNSIQPLILLGEYDRAFAASERARQIFTELGEERRLASLDNNVGNIFHRQDRFDQALAHYERAYKALFALEDWEHVAVTLHNMAMCLINLNDFPRSLDCYQKSRDLCMRHGLPRLRDQADYNIAYLYYFRGEYSRAIEMLLVTRRACEMSGDIYRFALCHLDLSDIYLELNLSEEAREMAHEGFLRFEKLGIGYEAAKTLANEAIAYGQQGKTVQALERFAKAREIFSREKNLVWPWLLDLYQGLLLFHEGRYFEARRLCAAAAEFFDGSPLAGKALLARLLLARIALQVGDLAAAEAETNAAVAKLSNLQAPVLAYQTHLLLGQIAGNRGDRVCEEPHASVRGDGGALSRSREQRDFGRRSVFVHRGGEVAEHDRDDFSKRPKLAHGRSGSERVREEDSRFARGIELVLPPDGIGTASTRGEVARTRRAFAAGSASTRERAAAGAAGIAGSGKGKRDSGGAVGFFRGEAAGEPAARHAAGGVLLDGRPVAGGGGQPRRD